MNCGLLDELIFKFLKFVNSSWLFYTKCHTQKWETIEFYT
jgi:hypothetical protein